MNVNQPLSFHYLTITNRFLNMKASRLFILNLSCLCELSLFLNYLIRCVIFYYFNCCCFCSTQTLEDINFPDKPQLRLILRQLDKIFAAIFVLEMLITWIAYGLKKYFTDGWCWLDFIVVVVCTQG